MTTLNDFAVTDFVTDVLAQYVNQLMAGNLRGELTETKTISATLVLNDGDVPIQNLNPSGADQIVTLALESAGNHVSVIRNAGSTYSLIIKNNSGVTTFATIAPGGSLIAVPIGGITWAVSGILDGDKGDITVSVGGTVWTINNGAITLAKIVDATGQYKIMARSTPGAGDWEELSGSSNVFSILQAADYAAIRTLLGLVIGTNIQAYNSVLTTLAGASANGQSLITAADYAAMRALLDLEGGTDFPSYATGTIASSATPTPTGSATRTKYTVTALAEAATFGAPSGSPVDGNMLLIRIKDNGTARALSFNAIYRAMGTALPTTTVLSKTKYLLFIYNSADSKWDLISAAQEA